MRTKALQARDISYASSMETKAGRAVVRMLENTTGRLSLLKRARGYEKDVGTKGSFFDVMVARYGLTLSLISGRLKNIPASGPLIVIANHPYGILDGLILGHVLSQTRPEFRILANSVLNRAPELSQHLLPIRFEGTKSALAENIASRRSALGILDEGGAIGVFPGGTVSTGAGPFSHPIDPTWRNFTARMVAKSRAQVVPIYFDGNTSRLFQIASHLHMTLRIGLLMQEFRKRVDTSVRIAIGAPIGRDELDPFDSDSKAMMDFLRKATYELSPEPNRSGELGFEFEKHRRA